MNNRLIHNKIIKCRWKTVTPEGFLRYAKIIDRSESVEGIGIRRYEGPSGSRIKLDGDDGHILTVLSGKAILDSHLLDQRLTLRAGVHAYIPPGFSARLRLVDQTSGIHASASDAYARGNQLLLHDEAFLCVNRFVLTPQYLSRRAFLHRDETLVSRSGDPVAWFHTTMLDTNGLPPNDEGLGVFKMSYNHQSEINVIYDLARSARVRFAHHPYSSTNTQRWSDWAELSDQTTYYLNESSSGDEIETVIDPATGQPDFLRNKHEIFIEENGYVSLCCLFDPGPTGMERHLPGEYSAYAPVRDIVNTPEYRRFLEQVAPLDEMLQSLSMAVATDPDVSLERSNHWDTYQSALINAEQREQAMIDSEASGRESILDPWRTRFQAHNR